MRRYTLTGYLNNTLLPATRELAEGWEPGRHSVDVLRGYQHGDKLWRVEHTLDITAEELPESISEHEWEQRLCDRLFRYLNMDERPNGATERSLSMGDVVAVSTPSGTTYYACGAVGWSRTAPPTGANILN